jgi:hypothetical protein
VAIERHGGGVREDLFKKRDYVAQMDCSTAVTVMRSLKAAFEHYNEVHPHSALKMLSPRMYRRNAQQSVTGCPQI